MDDIRRLLDYCCILLHDHMTFTLGRVSNSFLIELFIRNSLKVSSTSQVIEYFENHVAQRSVIKKVGSSKLKDQIYFHNKLSKTNRLYYNLIPLTTVERGDMKDIRHIKYRILAYEVANNINGIQPFNSFFKQRLIFQTPPRYIDEPEKEIKQNTAFNATPYLKPKIMNATVKTKKHKSGSDSENETPIVKKLYALCDDFGLKKLIVEIQTHAQSSCCGTIRHSLGNNFFKPSLRLECSSQGKDCCTKSLI